MDVLLCSFNDADVYARDLKLMRPGQWLNDACINICLRLLEAALEESIKHKILLMDPSVASFLRLQCSEDDEFQEVYTGNQLASKEYILVPINDNESFANSSSHWSLLIMHVPSLQFWHLDSHGSYNYSSAFAFAGLLVYCYRVSGHVYDNNRDEVPGLKDLRFRQVPCPQQGNGYDCGVYVLMFAESLCSYLSRSHGEDVIDDNVSVVDQWIVAQNLAGWREISDSRAEVYRQQKHEEIIRLR